MASQLSLWRTINNKIPTRFNIGLMAFIICFITFLLRANISLSILAMVNSNHSNESLPDYGPRYDWSSTEQGLIIGGFFWGYFISMVPLGFLAEWYGCKPVVASALIASTILTALTPITCEWSFLAIYLNRVLLGISNGAFYPSLHSIISKWVPPNEKGKFFVGLLGGSCGVIFSWQFSGILIVKFGWINVYYGTAVVTLLITFAWLYLVSNNPDDHPRITEHELKFIRESLGDNVSKEKRVPPYLKMLSSIPVIALILLHYGNLWGNLFILTAAPKFMSEVLHFDLTSAGILASLPHSARFLAGFIFGYIGDLIREHNWMTPTTIRKFFCIFSHIIPGLLLLSLSYVGDNAYACVAIMTISLGSNGSAILTNLQNSHDLSPNFAGSLYGMINFIAVSTGFISPMIVAYFTQEQSTIDEWKIIFTIAAAAYILPVIIFWFFGSGEVQPWNETKSNKSDNEATQQHNISA